MEKGKTYEVYYKDDTQTRHKTLEFIDVYEGLINFHNNRNGNKEIIPVNNIIRIQGNKENGKRTEDN